ncbi:MAG TPA: DUF3303 family protein, partial [Acidimicrobiales bacterium]
PGEIAHYVLVDGSGGLIIEEADDLTEDFKRVLAYSEFLEIDITPVLKIDDAVGPLLDYVGGA